MQLKMFVLSGAALTLWLVPLTALDKRIGWHKSMQGMALCTGIACAVTAGNIARKQSEQNEIEAIKTRAITADVICCREHPGFAKASNGQEVVEVSTTKF